MSVGERNGMQAHLFGKPRLRMDDITGRTGKEHCVRRANWCEDWSVEGGEVTEAWRDLAGADWETVIVTTWGRNGQ